MKTTVFFQHAKYEDQPVDTRLPARRTVTVRPGASILAHGEHSTLWPDEGQEWQRADTPLQPGGGRKGALRRRLSGADDGPRLGK
ncbi:hypothetical protein OKW49_008461 [Paraburkholderia youngii]|uniref:hypothetical protein n=1 Tax=Paraburkholderia youngii TaxID=2782701 RepID=UPI003D23B891